MEAEMKAARERAIVPQEVRVQHFMEMLAEKEVSLTSWDITSMIYYLDGIASIMLLS